MVILTHSYALTGNDSQEVLVRLTHGQWTLGGLAVAVFFMISGFLVSHSYLNSKDISEFILKRFLRIFPGLAVVILLSAFLLGPIISELTPKEYFTHPQTYHYLHTIVLFPIEYVLPGVFGSNLYPNAVNGSIWTIPYEVLCYIGVCLLGGFGFFKQKKTLIALFLIIFCVMSYLPESILITTKNGITIRYLLELSCYFLVGAIFYFYHNKIKYNYLYLALSLVVLIYCSYQNEFKNAFMLAGAYVVFHFAFDTNIKLSNFSKYGDFSYGLYIYAFPVQQLVQHLTINSVGFKGNFLISFVITLILAFLSWHIVEKNFIKKKSYFYTTLKRFQKDVSLASNNAK